MSSSAHSPSTLAVHPVSQSAAPGRRRRRVVLWATLIGLLLVAQSLLLWLTANYESRRAQEQLDTAIGSLAVELKHALERDERHLHALQWNEPSASRWTADSLTMMRRQPALWRIERRDAQLALLEVIDSPLQQPAFAPGQRQQPEPDTALACATAKRRFSSAYSRSFFVPMQHRIGAELMDLCIPMLNAGSLDGFVIATYSLSDLLDAIGDEVERTHELSIVESDGTRVARAGRVRGARVFTANRVVDLPGSALQLHLESGSGRPQLIPNRATALVLGLSLALTTVVLLLVRDVRKRARAEAALAESLAFRKAMEDSLVTGLYARDLSGRINYVNPAFCALVGYSAGELIGQSEPPYWPPEMLGAYRNWHHDRVSGRALAEREGIEATFMHRNGERIAVMIFEAPLVDGAGRHAGWMNAAVDVSGKQKMEELARQQQERLQVTARLVTVGEMASMLSHELNQPLAAIASYATGSLNLIDDPEHPATSDESQALLRLAVQRMAEQAERAGRVIRSVHDFVRRRERASEVVGADQLVNAVLPLVRLQARKSGARVELDLPRPIPRVVCDRTMLEQVLLNLTRNGLQAMEAQTPLNQRELLIRVRQLSPQRVTFSVIDRGTGIAPDVAERLFSPFFTTRAEGMGLGLSLCRTVIEQHGGTLRFENLRSPQDNTPTGAEFHFSLAADVSTSASIEPALHAADGLNAVAPEAAGAALHP
jgi:two-component system sensor histidine kinase DctS